MPTVQSLKKKLKGIRTTQKVTKAMKTAATVKYSRISAVYEGYAAYENECMNLYKRYSGDFNKLFAPKDENAPKCYVILSSNKGMCGSFNSDLLAFGEEIVNSAQKPVVFLCGKQAEIWFNEKSLHFDKSFNIWDVPDFESAMSLFAAIYTELKEGKISSVEIIYPEYKNMINQIPVCRELFIFEQREEEYNTPIFVPDKESVIANISKKIITSIIYKKLLETALGAQAATLMTMRSAYDTATEYCNEIEGDINRKRQSQVTADVIETSSEHADDRKE